ncbi:MAG: 4-coumarate--CoA ligase [Desulfovibrio sp.]|jgi:4-coumarate--CoA ligase (photoactive yellow protein activation family)|nr:4-coumarate--CoA ligase [Desulfovibrio sp.]
MSSLDFSREDVLLVLQGLAQALRGQGGRHVSDKSLFIEIRSLKGFTLEQRRELAGAALAFFDLDRNAATAGGPAETLLSRDSLEEWADLLFSPWDKAHLCFSSSGSTGRPLIHRYDMPQLTEEIRAAAPAFAGRERVVSVMPPHHIFGMMYGPLVSKYLGLPLAHASPLPLSSFFGLLRPGDLLVAFPLFWKALLDMIDGGHGARPLRFPGNVLGLTATSPCPKEVITGLLGLEKTKSPPLVGMKEIYGSTETNGVGMRHDGGEWYALFSHWRSVMLPDGSRALLAAGTGQAGKTVPLPDRIIWKDDRHFKPEKRADNAVQVGGINVYPLAVAARIREHPLVRDCAVRLMRPEEGARLKAFIVPALPLDRASQAFGKDFKDWLAATFDAPSRPKSIRLGASLPVNAMGKACDWD